MAALDKAGSGSVDDADFNALVDAVRSSMRKEIIPISYTDIDTATGNADMYLLSEGETIVMSWVIVTETFDGLGFSSNPFSGAQMYGPGGFSGGSQLSDTFDLTTSSIANAIDGLMGPDPADGGGGNTTTAMIPLVSPVPGGGSAQTVISFTAADTPVTQGTQGQLYAHLLITSA